MDPEDNDLLGEVPNVSESMRMTELGEEEDVDK